MVGPSPTIADPPFYPIIDPEGIDLIKINASHSIFENAHVGVGGIVTSANGNILGATVNSIFAVDANGNPVLANNGGSTQTIALAAGSPAIGVAAYAALATLDPRIAA